MIWGIFARFLKKKYYLQQLFLGTNFSIILTLHVLTLRGLGFSAPSEDWGGGSPGDPKIKNVIAAQKSLHRIIFCPKLKFGIFTIFLNRIWNLSSIISHLQAKSKRYLFFYPDFPFINLMMCSCFYYIYHRIPKNTSIELKVCQNGCFRVSFEFV